MTHSPRAFPWEKHLPWAPARVRESTAARPERADRARGIACAKGVGASISRGVGTSATARIRNAGGRSTAGRRRGGKPDIASTPTSKPSTPRLRKSAASERSPRLRLLRTQKLRRRVVTQQKLFFPSVLRSAGLPRPPVNSPRNPARYCCPACRQAVRNVQDRERKWLSRGTLDGRKKRAIEYQAARRRRVLRARPHPSSGTVAATSAVTSLPGRAGRQLSRRLLRG